MATLAGIGAGVYAMAAAEANRVIYLKLLKLHEKHSLGAA
jgi:hypothetical protein